MGTVAMTDPQFRMILNCENKKKGTRLKRQAASFKRQFRMILNCKNRKKK